ncbi:MAG: hypothetical protein ABIR70_24415 [Bryobacteraceae bacterium]
MKRLGLFLLAIAPLFAQQPELDSTGNGMLSGTYNFREALWITDLQATNDLNEAASQYGTITFDGRGNYQMSASEYSSRTNAVRNYVRAGTYTITASGFGLIRRVSDDGDIIYGSVANGVFIGSTTESGFNDLFIAAKQAATPITTATFNQRYTLAYMNLPATSLTQIRDATYQILPNGAGSLGSVAVSGFVAGNYSPGTQTISNASYSFANGIGTLNFGTKNSTDLVSGSQQLFVSENGQFIFGGSTNGWDMFVGIRTPTAASTSYNGLYYQAGMDVKRSTLPSGTAVLGSYYGAFNVVNSVKSLIGHQRIQTAPDAPYEYTYSDIYNLSASGAHDDFLGLQNFVATDGTFRIGFGRLDYLGLNVAIKAPTFSGTGIYLNPTGVVNAGSFTPFTTGLAPGELITLFGTGFATSDNVDATFPFTLGGVSVRINGRNAPIYVVTPGQISAIVPYETQPGVAEIQVIRGAVTSNRVTVYVNKTAPGVFAVPPTGLGYAAALHPDYSLVTPLNPARPGETIAVYLTGLGLTNPQVANGAAGPLNPLAEAVEFIDVSVANRSAKVVYAGLAPTLRGLYQLNFEIPAGVPAGDQYIDIGGPDSFNSQILMSIGGSRSAVEADAPRHTRPQPAYRSPFNTRKGFDPAATGSSSSPSRDR